MASSNPLHAYGPPIIAIKTKNAPIFSKNLSGRPESNRHTPTPEAGEINHSSTSRLFLGENTNSNRNQMNHNHLCCHYTIIPMFVDPTVIETVPEACKATVLTIITKGPKLASFLIGRLQRPTTPGSPGGIRTLTIIILSDARIPNSVTRPYRAIT